MKMNCQPHDNFTWLDQSTRGQDRMALCIKGETPFAAETAVPVTQVQFVVQVAPYQGDCGPSSRRCSAACVQHLDPFQHLAKLAVMCPGIGNHASAQCSWYPRPELQSSPTQVCELI